MSEAPSADAAPPRRVLVTGAAGNIGGKVCRHLEAGGRYELVRLDLDPQDASGVVRADLATADPAWIGLFAGVDTVIHLAAWARARAAWPNVVGPNVDALLNVYLAAVRHGVRRVIFASSVWSLYGYRFTADRLDGALPPEPTNPYGATRLFGERVGKCFLDQHGIETVAFRIGACGRGESRADHAMTRGDWEQACWVSDRDLCQAMEKAIIAPSVGFAILNLTSSVEGSRWSLEDTRRVLGYEPQDPLACRGASPAPPPGGRGAGDVARGAAGPAPPRAGDVVGGRRAARHAAAPVAQSKKSASPSER